MMRRVLKRRRRVAYYPCGFVLAAAALGLLPGAEAASIPKRPVVGPTHCAPGRRRRPVFHCWGWQKGLGLALLIVVAPVHCGPVLAVPLARLQVQGLLCRQPRRRAMESEPSAAPRKFPALYTPLAVARRRSSKYWATKM